MRKYQIPLGLFIVPLIFLVGFKKNTEHQSFLSARPASINSHVSSSAELPEVMIADATAIQGDKGQTSLEVLVFLSQAAAEAVTMEYITENGTAKAGADFVASSGSIRFEPGEVEKWITVSIVGEVAADPDEDAPAAADVSFQIKLQKVKNAIPKKINAIITIIKNILRDPRFAAGNKSVYEVHLNYSGFTSFYSDLITKCPISRNGRVTLYGYLAGYEKTGRYDPVLYTGVLYMVINMDICSMERRPNGEDELCGINVRFVGEVMTELEIDSTTEQGGYIQIHQDTTKHFQLLKSVNGDCHSQNGEEYQMVPNKSISSVFNGRQLTMLLDVVSGLPLKTLRIGDYSETDEDGNKTVLRVLRKVR